jgi:hypothetical protein
MPSRALIEAAVVTAVEAVLSGGSVEDDRIECKSELMPPDRVRQLAGAANAALGEDLIWVVGIDEKAKALTPLNNPEIDLADWWAQVERNFDGAVAPDFISLWVPVSGGSVLALYFNTDRAPYVIKNPSGSRAELEVPWRSATRTRSARRHELLKMLLPVVSTPEATLLSSDGLLTANAERKLQFKGQVNLYIEHIHSSTAVLPAHKMLCTLELWGVQYLLTARPLITIGPATDSGGVETLRNGIYCSRSGLARLELFGNLGELEPNTPERLRDLDMVTLKLEVGVVGSRRPIKKDFTLRSIFDQAKGETLMVPLELRSPTEDGSE